MMQFRRAFLRTAMVGALMVASAVVAPSSAVAADRAEPAEWAKVSAELRRTVKPTVTPVTLVMPGKGGRVGITATRITCYVYAWGPASSNGGRGVQFAIDIMCEGGLPGNLEVTEMDMWRYPQSIGQPHQVPGSFNSCYAHFSPYLSCVSNGPCYQAGSVYDGMARLFAIDEVGGTHLAVVYAPPRQVGCLV